MNKGTFPNEEKKQWEEKCPKCNEEFNRSRGGPQCQTGKCSDLDLQNEHERVLPLMVACALPNYKGHVNSSVPKDWDIFGKGLYDGNMGVSNAFAIPPWIKIAWYTCRIKGTFFDTVAHEAGHINAIHAKTERGTVWFNSTQRRVIRKAIWLRERDKSKLEKFVNNPKYRDKINYFQKEWNKTNEHIFPSLEKGHEKTAWQNEYVQIHGTLMGSKYAWYNYKKTQPKKYPLSVTWKGFT